eukprot:CAMPEP_0197284686 /NCGR_PEP_ID=MMETSP1432-20130617/25570_1 /TAXON_ID=44447 /ORGANISM="Pseudo-nitzschia delicatissima, Strain UNC1205" /LENGTH=112 /DNA_ID=CAMNT_0042751701 /DNA_START=517 /DNA_END=851 /DNA_ORIENTATION=+
MPDLTIGSRLLDGSRHAALVVGTSRFTGRPIHVGKQEKLHLLQLVPGNLHGLVNDKPRDDFGTRGLRERSVVTVKVNRWNERFVVGIPDARQSTLMAVPFEGKRRILFQKSG